MFTSVADDDGVCVLGLGVLGDVLPNGRGATHEGLGLELTVPLKAQEEEVQFSSVQKPTQTNPKRRSTYILFLAFPREILKEGRDLFSAVPMRVIKEALLHQHVDLLAVENLELVVRLRPLQRVVEGRQGLLRRVHAHNVHQAIRLLSPGGQEDVPRLRRSFLGGHSSLFFVVKEKEGVLRG